jgi:O-antigen ligase
MVLMGLLLFSEYFRTMGIANPVLRDFRDLINRLVLLKTFQLVFVTGFAFFSLFLIWIVNRGQGSLWKCFPRTRSIDLFRIILVAVALFWVLVTWQNAVPSDTARLFLFGDDQTTDVLVLILSLALGQAIEVFAAPNPSLRRMILFSFVFFLVIASLTPSASPHTYIYRDHQRWTGPWTNPNIFGLLMSAGIVLSMGLLFENLLNCHGSRFLSFVYVFAIDSMIYGLINSYSRGALVALCVGSCFLLMQGMGGLQKVPGVGFFKKRSNAVFIAAIACCVALLTFWHFRQAHWAPARRALAAGNQNDFSWRNRIATWEATLQMMVEKPWSGHGWNQPEPSYQYYLPVRIGENRIVLLNDYLRLGVTLGIPALFCFGLVVTFSMVSKIPYPDWPKLTCQAGAIVLLVGFWFDGGLFKLSTAMTFWILLEFGKTFNTVYHGRFTNTGQKQIIRNELCY